MKRIAVDRPGGPEQLALVDVPVPEPGDADALVKIAYSGVNFIDVYFRTGLYKADLPVALGSEARASSRAVGPDVTESRPAIASRTRWCAAPTRSTPSCRRRSWSRFRTASICRLAAATMLQGMTAHYLTHSTFPLARGQTLPRARRRRRHRRAHRPDGKASRRARVRHGVDRGEGAGDPRARRRRGHHLHAAGLRSRGQAPHRRPRRRRRLRLGRQDDIRQEPDVAPRPRGMLALFGQSSGPVPPVDPAVLNQQAARSS